MAKIKTFLAAVIAALMVMLNCVPVYAADNITSIRINIDETKREAGVVWDAEPSTNSSDYELTEYSWSSDDWTPGSVLTLTCTLETTGDKNFSKDASVSVSNGEVASKKRNSADKFTVKVNYTPKVILEMPEGVYYEDEYTLVWDKVQYAGGYEVRLFKDGSSSAFKTVSVEGRGNTSVDLSDYVTDDYDVTVAIRAVPSSGKKSYITASDWYSFDDEYMTGSGNSSVYGEFTGSGSNLKFKMDDDYAWGWEYINGNWYYFDPDNGNRAVTDQWKNIDGVTYAFDSTGKMLTGWVKSGDFWFYCTSSGAMATGWVQSGPNSPWYYLAPAADGTHPYGAMYADEFTPDGYYVDANGEWH